MILVFWESVGKEMQEGELRTSLTPGPSASHQPTRYTPTAVRTGRPSLPAPQAQALSAGSKPGKPDEAEVKPGRSADFSL